MRLLSRVVTVLCVCALLGTVSTDPAAAKVGGDGSVEVSDSGVTITQGPNGRPIIKPPNPYKRYVYTATCMRQAGPEPDGTLLNDEDALCVNGQMSCSAGERQWWRWAQTVRDGRPEGDFEAAGVACVGDNETRPRVPPIVAAAMVYARMDFAKIQIGMVPEEGAGRLGLVGLPAWMWVANDSPAVVGPQLVTDTAEGLEVTIDARVNGVTWTMGDGTTISCQGAATPYSDSAGASDSPDCGHRYTKPGNYTVTAQPNWEVNWSVARTNASGTFPNPIEASQRQVRVGELQVLNGDR